MLFSIIITSTPATAKADTGPKPSIKIDFTGFGDEECYATILIQSDHYIFWEKYEGNLDELTDIPTEAKMYCECDLEVWKAFVKYQDKDDYYFVQRVWRVKDGKTASWTYMAPERFKLVLYFPSTGTFVTSDVMERYAFESHYIVDKGGIEAVGQDMVLKAEEDYDYSGVIKGAIFRLLITLAIEMLIALLFKYRSKRQLFIILLTNIVTQLGLNIILVSYVYKEGAGFSEAFLYIIIEIAILIIEAIVYSLLLNKGHFEKKVIGKAVGYAALANIVSFLAGFWCVLYML